MAMREPFLTRRIAPFMQANYPDKPFDQPVTLHVHGGPLRIDSVNAAYDLLIGKDWPGERDARYRDLCDLCLKVFDGHRSTAEARKELVALAEDSGLMA